MREVISMSDECKFIVRYSVRIRFDFCLSDEIGGLLERRRNIDMTEVLTIWRMDISVCELISICTAACERVALEDDSRRVPEVAIREIGSDAKRDCPGLKKSMQHEHGSRHVRKSAFDFAYHNSPRSRRRRSIQTKERDAIQTGGVSE